MTCLRVIGATSTHKAQFYGNQFAGRNRPRQVWVQAIPNKVIVIYGARRCGKLYVYEIEYGDKKVKVPTKWKSAYEKALYTLINTENYLDFVC